MNRRPVGLSRAIGQLNAVLTVCFVLMTVGLGYWGLVRAPALIERDDNPRKIEDERRIRRGDILDRRGRPLVRSQAGALGTWERIYAAPAAAPVVGYYSINHGTGGIESAYDASIRGERALGPIQQLEANLLHLYSAGVSVTLTLDLALEQTADHSLGEWPGAIVLLNVRSGDILAMVSHPTFDPNTLEADWPQLQYAANNPLLNRAAQGLYPPGLIFQTITMAAIMEEGLAGPTTVFTDRAGVIMTVDPPIACPDDPPRTRFTLFEAYTWPCNVLFARLGLEMGGEKLADFATRLGVGLPVDLPIPVAAGQILERGIWSDLLAARTAMGQGELLVTPLEMALVVATIANDGARPAPRLVLDVGGEPGAPPGDPHPALDVKVAQQLQTILRQAFAVGYPGASAIDIAGRGGTAKSGRAGAPPHAWFIGFAPSRQPRYAVAVIAEHGGDGWAVAAPIAVQVLGQAIQEQAKTTP